MKLVMIRWVDSAFLHGWVDRDSVKTHQPSDCVSVGLLVNEGKEHITIVQSASKEQVGDGLTIPKCCIKKMWQLKVKC